MRCCCQQVRTSPVYHLIQARVLEAKNDLEGAFKVLDAAMRLPGVRRKAGTEAGVPAISQHDRASLFIMVCRCRPVALGKGQR